MGGPTVLASVFGEAPARIRRVSSSIRVAAACTAGRECPRALRALGSPRFKDQSTTMKRLAAAAILALSLSACDGGSKPAPVAPAPAKPAPTVATAYKATPSPTLEAVRKRGY